MTPTTSHLHRRSLLLAVAAAVLVVALLVGGRPGDEHIRRCRRRPVRPSTPVSPPVLPHGRRPARHVSPDPVTPGAASEVVNAVERARVGGGVTHPDALDVAAHHLSRHHGWRYADARAFVFRLDEEL